MERKARQSQSTSRPFESPISRRSLLANAARGTLALGAVGVPAWLLAACDGDATSPVGSIKPGGTLLAGVASDPDSLDPQKSSLAVSSEIYAGIFSRLVDLRPNGEIAPSLATAWTSPDPTRYVFTLRPDVVFHNGQPLTPADVVYTFERMTDRAFGATYAADFAALQRVEATGPNEVTFHLKEPFAPFLGNLANRGHILSKAAVTNSDPALEPIGTGPFMFETWNHGQNLVLKKNQKYFIAGRPYLDVVEFRYRPVDQSRILALKANELGWVDGIPDQNVASIKSDRELRYMSSSVTGKPEFLLLNTSRGPLANRALRQAVCWAVDRKKIAELAFFNTVEPGAVEVGRTSSWYTDSDPYASGPDPDAVRRKLAEAGYPDGVTLTFMAWTTGPDATRTGQIIQQQLKPYNITIEIEPLEISVWLKRLFGGEYDLTLAFQEQLVDPDNFWSLMFTTNAAQNVTGYGNATVDGLVRTAAATTDVAARKDLYAQIRRQVLDDAPLLFTAYLPLDYATRSNVIGAEITPTQDPQFVNIGLA